jgi:hypothetical protein
MVVVMILMMAIVMFLSGNETSEVLTKFLKEKRHYKTNTYSDTGTSSGVSNCLLSLLELYLCHRSGVVGQQEKSHPSSQ